MKNRVNFYWRLIGSGISFSIFGIGTLILSLVFFLLIRLAPVPARRKHHWVLAVIKTMCSFFVSLMRLFGLYSLSYQGLANLPSGGHLIIANHPSLIDALFIAAKADNLCCIVKTPLMSNPFTAYIVRLAGYIPNQSETLLSDASEAVANGKNLLVFPEGTRNTEDRQLDFKRGAANIALFANCPITPVVIEIAPRLLQKGHKWYQIPSRPSQIVVSVHQTLSPFDMVNQARPVPLQARELNRKLVEFYQGRLACTREPSAFALMNNELNESAG